MIVWWGRAISASPQYAQPARLFGRKRPQYAVPPILAAYTYFAARNEPLANSAAPCRIERVYERKGTDLIKSLTYRSHKQIAYYNKSARSHRKAHTTSRDVMIHQNVRPIRGACRTNDAYISIYVYIWLYICDIYIYIMMQLGRRSKICSRYDVPNHVGISPTNTCGLMHNFVK